MKRLLFLLAMLLCFTGSAKTSEAFKVLDNKEVSTYFQDGRKKTVHVKSYRRKNGTIVKSHYRRPPKRH